MRWRGTGVDLLIVQERKGEGGEDGHYNEQAGVTHGPSRFDQTGFFNRARLSVYRLLSRFLSFYVRGNRIALREALFPVILFYAGSVSNPFSEIFIPSLADTMTFFYPNGGTDTPYVVRTGSTVMPTF